MRSMFLALGNQGSIYALTEDLHALNPSTGQRLWSQSLSLEPGAAPVIGCDEIVYAAGLNGWVYATEGRSGQMIWRSIPTSGISGCPVLADNGNLFIGDGGNTVWEINGKTGSVNRVYYALARLSSSLMLGTGGILFLGIDEDGPTRSLCALRVNATLAQTGWPMFQQNPQHTGRAFYQPRIDGLLLVAGTATVTLPALVNQDYSLEYKDFFTNPDWTGLAPVKAKSNSITLKDTTATNQRRYYRVRMD
jgi:hypothetical protein